MEYNLPEFKSKVVHYLIESHIGRLFSHGSIDPQNISVNISSGDAHLRNLQLDVEFLNEIGDQLNFPLTIVQGYLDELHINAPWRSFWSGGVSLQTEFVGLRLTLEPKEDIDDAASMWSSAIGRLVEKSNTYKSKKDNEVVSEETRKVDDFINYLMSKMTVNFKDIVICFQPRNSELGVKFTIRLESLRFYDDQESSKNVPERVHNVKNRREGSHSNTSYSSKSIDVHGVSFWMTDVLEEDGKKEIKLALFSGQHQIKIYTKETELGDGPGIWVHMQMGDFLIFLTPRQLYLLADFLQKYGDTDDESKFDNMKRVPKQMTDSDFEKLETVLQQQTFQANTQNTGLPVGYGWSSVPTDQCAEQFYSMTADDLDDDCANSILSGSVDEANFNSSIHSATFSEIAPSSIGRIYNNKVASSHYSKPMSEASSATMRPSYDPGKDMFLIDFHVSSLVVLLLHEDVWEIGADGVSITRRSFERLQTISSEFFDKMQGLNVLNMMEKDVNYFKDILDDTCRLSHIRLLASPFHSSFEVESSKKKCEATFKMYGLTLSECLFESKLGKLEEVPLLKFEEPQKECLVATLTNLKRYNTRTDLVICLRRCAIEMDITIIDRLATILSLPLFSGETESSSKSQSRHLTRFEIDVPYANLKLRFPIPDFTPLHDPKRVPWWRRNVRNDFMTFRCHQFKFQTSFSTPKKSEEYSIRFDVVDVYYNESAKAKPIYIAQIGDRDQKFDECKFDLKILPTVKLFNLEEEEDEVTRNTFSKEFLQTMDNGPFTSKKVVHHSRAEHADDSFPEPEFLIPGDRKEIETFKTSSRNSSKMIINIVLSSVKLQITSKFTYELIYNRICNDMLTWVPSAPVGGFKPKTSEAVFDEYKTAFRDDQSDSSDYSDNEDYGLFQSTYDYHQPKLENRVPSPTFVKKYVTQSKLVIDLKIVNGTVAFNPPVRGGSAKTVVPGRLGYFAIDLSEANIFMVSGYKGDQALDYLCVDVRGCDMRHNEMMSHSEVKICLPDLRRIPNNLYPVVSKSISVLVEERKNHTERPMLTVACKILTRHETHHVKTVKVALGLNKATLHHRMTVEPNSWVSQLIDFFKVTDFPINGYKPKEVLSEFHLHTWDCAIDYRPLYMPLRCVVTLGNFNMTSNVSEVSSGSKLRFLAEDCDLYLSRENPPKYGVASNVPVDIRREYVNVVNLNMLELSLVMKDKQNKLVPRLDLRVSTDYLKIHTCSDSLKALADLIGYIAVDGDLAGAASSSEPSGGAYESPKRGADEPIAAPVVHHPLEISEATQKQRQKINDLIGEAVADEVKIEKYNPEDDSTICEFRYLPHIQRELGDFNSSDDEVESSYIIISERTNDVIRMNNGMPKIKWLTKEPVIIQDDFFFVPVSAKDFLSTPDEFPVPTTKYTLCELNVVWQIYGGRDFRKIEDRRRERKDSNVYSDNCTTRYSSCESVYSSVASSSHRERRNSDRDGWKLAGGPDRNKNVMLEIALNRLRCQYDVYPENTEQAHRFALQIKEFEINDRLKSSEFNKFLCQYLSESMPIPTNAQMFVTEAVNTRPRESGGDRECSLSMSLLPLRFYIDQDSLEFLFKFFTEVSQKVGEESALDKTSSKQSTPLHQPPKLIVKNTVEEKEVKEKSQDADLIDLDTSDEGLASSETTTDNYNKPLFFRPVSFGPDTFVKIDYKGKHLGATENSVTGMIFGLIMGLAEINNSTIDLKRICHRHGIDGIDKVFQFILQEWMDDIKSNQIQNVLISVGPMQSLVQLYGGVRDLFWMPFEQYQKDGRIVRGLKKGANSFTTSTALAALELTFKFIHLLQVTAETAYDILSPGPSVRQISNAKKRKKKYTQPQDIREGVTNAIWLVKEGIGETAESLVQVATQEHEQKGYVGVVGGLARQIPPNLIRPIIIASEATNNVLGGIRSQLVPDARLEAEQKWKNTYID